MTIDPELYELFAQTIVVENPIPVAGYTSVATGVTPAPVLDAYGRHANPLPDGSTNTSAVTYQAPATYRCRLEYSTKIMADTEGRNRVSSGRAYLLGYYPQISTEARLTVPSQVQPALQHPLIAFIENNYDETGLGGYNTTIHFE